MDKRLMRESPWQALHELEKRVSVFADGVQRSDYLLVAVVDADAHSAEVSAKWRSRRERELRTEMRNLVLGMDAMLSDALAEHGVPVVRMLGADADDVLASLAASFPGSCVLSNDDDFYGYQPELVIYHKWRLPRTGLVLEQERSGPRRAVTSRAIDPHLAEVALATIAAAPMAGAAPAIRDKYDATARGGRITRGVSSSSDLRMGNLHAIAAPLRAAVYEALGVTEAVLETIPEWDAAAEVPVWRESALQPDAALAALLGEAEDAAAWLDSRDESAGGLQDVPWPSSELKWRASERHFNRRVLACEMATVAACARQERARSGDAEAPPPASSLLARMRTFPEYRIDHTAEILAESSAQA